MTSPYSQLTGSTLELAERFYEILDLAKAELGIADVWFGDQNIVPRVPAVCVEPGVERRELQGVPDMVLMRIDTGISLYHSKVDRTQQVARRECVLFAENIKRFLHVNHLRIFSADGTRQMTIHGFCTELDPGYAFMQGSRYNAVQMVWTSTTKESLQRRA
jgi:hypothetical protein